MLGWLWRGRQAGLSLRGIEQDGEPILALVVPSVGDSIWVHVNYLGNSCIQEVDVFFVPERL